MRKMMILRREEGKISWLCEFGEVGEEMRRRGVGGSVSAAWLGAVPFPQMTAGKDITDINRRF